MKWHLDKTRPLCPQICEQLCVGIACGEFPPGSRLLSVREVAMAAGVNPNTVQKAFEELERQGLLYSIRGSGWYVGEGVAAANETVQMLLREKTAAYFEAMKTLGMSEQATKQYAEEFRGKGEEDHE